jgi:hypothetical protein
MKITWASQWRSRAISNGDGFDDLIVSANDANGRDAGNYAIDSGTVYVIFGHGTGFAAHFDPTTLNGQTGFRLIGESPYDHAGISANAAGDVNGDGFDDIIVGAVHDFGDGEAYVVFGMTGPFEPQLNLSALDGTNGFKLTKCARGRRHSVSPWMERETSMAMDLLT